MGNAEGKPPAPVSKAAPVEGKPPHSQADPGEGIKNIRTTNVFRAVNFELYAKPNKVVMLTGVLIFSSCVGYIVWWNITQKDKGPTYMALQEDGTLQKYKRTSRWD